MPGGNLNREILLNTVKSDMANGTSNAVPMIKRGFPELSNSKCFDLAAIIADAVKIQDADKVSLVVTAPSSFSINARTTMNVVQSMIAFFIFFRTCRYHHSKEPAWGLRKVLYQRH